MMKNWLQALSKRIQRGSPLDRALFCAAVGLCLAFGAQSAGLLRALEQYAWDARVRLLSRPSVFTDHIRIIELDQSSLDWGERENGLSWPWPREVYGLILDFCKRADVASLSFDVIFSEPSLYGVEDDRALAMAVRDNGRLILSLVLGEGKDTAWPEIVPFPPVEWRLATENAPDRASFPTQHILPGAAGMGWVNQLPDSDGVFRALQPIGFFDGKPVSALALAAYLNSQPWSIVSREAGAILIRPPGQDAGKTQPVVIPLDQEGRATLNFRGKGGTHTAFSAAGIIQSELRLREGGVPVISPEELRGKHVLFGFTAPALLDLRPSPTDGAFAGVEMHATFLDNLLANDFIRYSPSWPLILLTCFISVAAAFFVMRVHRFSQIFLLTLVCLAMPPAIVLVAYRALYWLPLTPMFLSVFISLTMSVILAYVTEGRQRRFLKNAFSQYLSPDVINQIIKDPGKLKLGGEKRILSVYFSDLYSFSTIAEGLSPEDLTRLLNEYLSIMSDIILEEGGTIDKYEGDAIIAFWNAPQEQADHAARALRAALRGQDALVTHQERLSAIAGRPVAMRIGLNTGSAVVGNMGSRSRFDYTMLGDSVNLASRLEGANKEFGTFLMASQSLMDAAKEQAGEGAFAARELALLQVVGRRDAVRVFEPMWPDKAAARADVLTTFDLGLKAFQSGEPGQAKKYFTLAADNDRPSAVYLRRCDELENGLVEKNSSGIWKLTVK
jgi:adenylate cyclase